MEYELLTGADLAFIGDAYYELYIRNFLLHNGLTKLRDLHQTSVKYVSSESQARIVTVLEKDFSDQESLIYKRGRNYQYKNKNPDYLKASGFEAVIGYLYLTKQEQRLKQLLEYAVTLVI